MKCNYYVAQEDVFRVFFFFRINIICLYTCIYIYMQTSMSMTRDSYSHRTQSCSVYFRSTRRPPYVELFFAWRALFADVKLCNIKKYAQTIHFVKIYKIQNVRRDLTELNLKLQKRYWECKFYASELHCIIILEILKKKKVDNLKLENKSFEVWINVSSNKQKKMEWKIIVFRGTRS